MVLKESITYYSFRNMEIILAIIIVVLFLFYKWSRSRRNFNELVEKIPHYVRPLPIIGHGHLFLGDSEHLLEQIYNFFSMPTPSKVWLLNQTFILIKKPENIQTILNSPKALEKHHMYRFMKPSIGEGLLSAPIQKWKKNRKLIMPTFKQNVLDQFVKIFYKQAVKLTDVLKSESGKVIDTSNFCLNFTVDVLYENILGLEVNSQVKQTFYSKRISRGMEIAWQRMFNFIYRFDFIFNLTKMSAEQRDLVEVLHHITETAIKEKQHIYKKNKEETFEELENRSKDEVGKVFLDLLIELEEEGVKLTNKELKDEVNTILISGTDTSATSLSFVLQILALHKNIQEKVYQEIINISGHDSPIAYHDLPNLVYLEKVIKETLRFFPIAPIMVRTATDDINLGNYIIPKGMGLAIGIGPMMRSEEYYENPLEFNPERFDPEEVAKRHPYTYLPFSGGSRNCLGTRYAMMMLKTAVSTIVRKYSLETTYRSLEEIKLKAHIVAKPIKGFPLILTERK